jgi:hypothetical protein
MLKCPIHELPFNIVINNFYARLTLHDKDLLDASCSGSFTHMKEEAQWDLLDHIQENTEGWENDKGRKSGINYDYECIKAFMGTDDFHNVSAVYGLDSQILANCFKAFASYLDVPKKDWNKYHAPYKDTVSRVPARNTKVCTIDRILPEPYFEKAHFPAKVKEHSTLIRVLKKSAKKAVVPDEKITVKSPVAIVKDLVTKNVEDGHIIFCEDASNIVSHPSRPRKISVHVLSVRIGDHCYYGLCDIGASSSAIPFDLYKEIMHEIGPCELEEIDGVIQLANGETISPIGIVRDVEVLYGKTKYPADFLILGTTASKTCPIIFGRPFLNTCGAVIDYKKENFLLSLMENLMSLTFLSLLKLLMKMKCLMKIFELNSLPLLLLLLIMPCSNLCRTMKLRSSGKKDMRLTRFFFVNQS